MNKMILLLFGFFIHFITHAQLPAILGPPKCSPATIPTGDIIMSVLKGMLIQNLDKKLDTINLHIDLSSAETGLKAKIDYEIQHIYPAFVPTNYTDKPNLNYIRITFYVVYNVRNIKWNSIPYLDKKISQAIHFSFYCNNWYLPDGGKSAFYTSADKPYLEAPSIGEQALNAVLGGWLINYVNSQINRNLPGSQSGQVSSFNNYKCSCLGLTPGTAPLREDGVISFGYLAFATVANPPTPSLEIKSIKRLPGLPNETLPERTSLQLEYYANHNKKTITTESMRVRDSIQINVLPIAANNTGRIGKLSVIFNATSAISGAEAESYTTSVEFLKKDGFGIGTHTITLMRKKWLPHASGPGRTPPLPLLIPAYEITFQIVKDVKVIPGVHGGIK